MQPNLGRMGNNNGIAEHSPSVLVAPDSLEETYRTRLHSSADMFRARAASAASDSRWTVSSKSSSKGRHRRRRADASFGSGSDMRYQGLPGWKDPRRDARRHIRRRKAFDRNDPSGSCEVIAGFRVPAYNPDGDWQGDHMGDTGLTMWSAFAPEVRNIEEPAGYRQRQAEGVASFEVLPGSEDDGTLCGSLVGAWATTGTQRESGGRSEHRLEAGATIPGSIQADNGKTTRLATSNGRVIGAQSGANMD